jgi:NADPH:quinone reductase-like Zn-dependent oxidoreductase
MILRGGYPLPIKPDLVPVSDGAGEVVALGEGVSRAKLGDRVAAAVFPLWIDGPFAWENSAQLGGSLDGMLTECAVLSEEALVPIADHLSFEEAATLPCAAVTAWNALTGGPPLLPGQTVLTQGSGGVSLFAIQFAKLFGTRVIATTSSEEKAERLKKLGADEVVNYPAIPEWHVPVRELTKGRGVDMVVEVGGAGTLEKSLKAATLTGQLSLVGWLASKVSVIDFGTIAGTLATMRRVAVGNRAQFMAMMEAIEANRLKPVIDRVFGFDDAVAAFRYYEAGKCFGKVVIVHE